MVDFVGKSFMYIPLKTKKKIIRNYSKAMIYDSIKSNSFAAVNMNKSMKSPLTIDSVKSINQSMAYILTDIRGLKNDIMYIDLNKVEGSKIKNDFIAKSIDENLAIDTHMDKDQWLKTLSRLQYAMIKSGVVIDKVSDYKIKKYIDDNDEKSLIHFYNGCLEELRG